MDDDLISQMIILIKPNYPCLCNVAEPDFKNANKKIKMEIWNEIADKLNFYAA